MNKNIDIPESSRVINFIKNKFRQGISKPARYYLEYQCEEQVNALTEDWDNLIILDACRYDHFGELSTISGELDRRLSVASATMEWLQKAVDGNEFYDIVYVSANPRVSRYSDKFHDVIPAWKTHWDEELKVVTPHDMSEVALQAYKDYPNKRIVVHYMQPHVPFIGHFGREKVGIYDGTTKGVKMESANVDGVTDHVEPYILLERGEIEKESIKKAYKENIQEILPEVERLLDEFSGKSVVTSDHGEMFGEFGWPTPFHIYGHEIKMPALKLLEVPWLVQQSGERRHTFSETPRSKEQIADESVIQERLRDLGYQ